jgi:hypothetical protein
VGAGFRSWSVGTVDRDVNWTPLPDVLGLNLGPDTGDVD